MRIIALALLLAGCDEFDIYSKADKSADTDAGDTGGEMPEKYPDADGDGYHNGIDDCDDDDATVNPGADEICDGIDNNCDGYVDEDDVCDEVPVDADNDGYTADEDCDDEDASIHPDADEDACDGVDNDCDGDTKDGSVPTWYLDGDSDGYGDGDVTYDACEAPPGFVGDNSDCDDDDALTNPGAEEVCDEFDNDCDGSVDEEMEITFYADRDGDGRGDPAATDEACDVPIGYVDNDSDCNDADANIYLGATEVCDGIDNDCDGNIDEDDAVDAATWYADSDGDGYGDAATSDVACDVPSGYVEDDTDCDDADSTAYPGGTEVCDGVDNDCNGDTDDAASDADTWYFDADADGYGDDSVVAVACSQPMDYVSRGGDCDDTTALASPAVPEVCSDSIDNDCDGDVDEDSAIDAITWYADTDGDGYGDEDDAVDACDVPSGYVADDTDCDDGNADVNPGEDEYCDGVDNNCDGDVDETDAVDTTTWYADADEDGYGDATTDYASCTSPEDFVDNADDCDDHDDDVNPDAVETEDGEDNDCDGVIDDGTDATDDDGDGYSEDDGDCNDADATVSPAADEYCDGIDNDCDDQIDEIDAVDAVDWYPDDDSDGYGDIAVSWHACEAPSGFVDNADDCDDEDATFHPGATEDDCTDAADYNCDGSVDYADADGDGWAACEECDDGNASVNPDAAETCNEVDDNCDGDVDEGVQSTFYADGDEDGYGDAAATTSACEAPSGYVEDDTDCDDNDNDNYPGADESCDGEDTDCDGDVDEGCPSDTADTGF